MPGCAAIGCNNRSEKGYTMKCFPREPILRQIWKDRVGRADWEPSNNSFLCHAHFAANQWMVTQCGRLKLRKGAIPSIFRVVTHRKSSNKRRRVSTDGKSEDDECEVEILDDEENNYVNVDSPERIQNLDDESVVFFDSQNSSILQNIKGKEGNSENNVYQIITTGSLNNLQHENLIMISNENDQEIGSLINNGNNYILINNENEDTTNHLQPTDILTNQMPLNSRIKVEVKDEVDDRVTTNEIYDEVESNMERIYEGINTDDESTKQSSSKMKIFTNKSLATIKKIEIANGFDSELSWQKNDVILNGQVILNDTIACLENSDDNKIPLISHSIKNGDFSAEDTEEEEIVGVRYPQEITNLEAALQRKKKAREETMKSIERIISDNGSPSKSQSCSESDFSGINSNDSNQRKKKRKSNFTIKVSGMIEDVSDIMRDFSSKPSLECSLEENRNQRQDYGDSCITSIIRVENSLPKIIKTERITDAESEGMPLDDDLMNYSKKFELKQERIVISSDSDFNQADFQDKNQGQDETEYQDHHEVQDQNHDQVEDQDQYELQDQENQDDHEFQELHEDENNYQNNLRRSVKRTRLSNEECKIDSIDIHHDLKFKLEQQEEIILKLTGQLSAYKGMEMKVTEVNDELKLKNREISILSAKLNRKESTQGRSRRNVATMQALIKDLTNKVKTIEDVNRRLSRSLTVEHQNKKNLEYQVRNREKAIKELNWKVGKASKLLERTEKNATTYKRRMNNMRALMRRRHFDLVDERHTPFDILFSDYARHDFSEESLKMALKIKKACGSDGYEKLLDYNFPLPSQRTLRRKYHKDSVFANGSTEMVDSLDTSNFKTIAYDINESIPLDSSVTVRGTVQDIFNELDDNELMNEYEVMSENELKERLLKFMNINF